MANRLTISRWFRWSYGLFIGVSINFILDVIFSLVYKNYNLFQPVAHYLTSIFLTYLVFEILFYFNRRLNKKYSWKNKPYGRFAFQLVTDSVIAIIIVEGLNWGSILLLRSTNYIRLIDEFIIIGVIIFVVLVFTIIELSIFLLNSWRYSLAELERFKKENAEIRFESLRSQLNPHFLFNSLNTLSALVYEDADKAGLFIRELSDVYRYILENKDNELVSLNKELDFAQSYIHLIKIRFGKNIVVENKITITNDKFQIAPLTLQLLIENAIKHNIISKKKPLHIVISVVDNVLIVSNKLQLKEKKEYSNEMGLKNIKSRYDFLTDRVVEISDEGGEFTVKIPLI
ncbi:MAG: histidine kinase [Bacteroidota bacterium]